ncbi:MAG: hypothetical protein ACRC9M_01630 [Aeromonas sp.]
MKEPRHHLLIPTAPNAHIRTHACTHTCIHTHGLEQSEHAI